MSLRQSKILSLLGLAMRGRNIASGELQTLEAVRKQTACVVLVAADASDNTRKLFTDKCTYYEIPVYIYGTKETLGRAIGKDFRSSVAVCEPGLADSIMKQLEMERQAAKAELEEVNGEN